MCIYTIVNSIYTGTKVGRQYQGTAGRKEKRKDRKKQGRIKSDEDE